MTRQTFHSNAHDESEEELSEDERFQAGIRKLVRLRSNLKALQLEISDKILNNIQDSQHVCGDSLTSTKEIRAAFTDQNK